IRTSAVEVSIQAVSPLSILTGAAAAGAALCARAAALAMRLPIAAAAAARVRGVERARRIASSGTDQRDTAARAGRGAGRDGAKLDRGNTRIVPDRAVAEISPPCPSRSPSPIDSWRGFGQLTDMIRRNLPVY